MHTFLEVKWSTFIDMIPYSYQRQVESLLDLCNEYSDNKIYHLDKEEIPEIVKMLKTSPDYDMEQRRDWQRMANLVTGKFDEIVKKRAELRKDRRI